MPFGQAFRGRPGRGFSLDLQGERAYSPPNRTTLDAFEEWVPATHSFASPDLNDQKIMTNDLVALIEFYEKEKSIEREKVVEALENGGHEFPLQFAHNLPRRNRL